MTAIMGRDKNHFQGTYKMLNSFALRAILRDRTRQLGWLAAYEQTEEEEKKNSFCRKQTTLQQPTVDASSRGSFLARGK